MEKTKKIEKSVANGAVASLAGMKKVYVVADECDLGFSSYHDILGVFRDFGAAKDCAVKAQENMLGDFPLSTSSDYSGWCDSYEFRTPAGPAFLPCAFILPDDGEELMNYFAVVHTYELPADIVDAGEKAVLGAIGEVPIMLEQNGKINDDFSDRDIYLLRYNSSHEKVISPIGYMFYSDLDRGGVFHSVEYSADDIPLSGILSQAREDVGSYVQDCLDGAREYEDDSLSEVDFVEKWQNYYHGVTPKPMAYMNLSDSTPCGLYYDIDVDGCGEGYMDLFC